ncbi:MAG: FKBP-type peptidyl-prolyl cis-trans isomerase [Gammaproteobacteria bacterium]|nr:FKBP-type peptidyl-prolyl cis-trans isomerase [Gammaproteobacteria bacterium]MDH5799667.1 FKBP-type peptidyl-prolyl cis-trans isomerase [Gammaproteobacteria bacterium]
MHKISSVVAAATIVTMAISPMASAAKPKSDKEKFSYTIGVQIGQSLKREDLDIDIKFVKQAMEDVLKDAKLQLTQQEMQQAYTNAQRIMAEKMAAKGEKSKKAGEDFLAKNKKKSGVKVTESGLQYKVVTAGNGAQPKTTDTVTVHYKGTLIDGKVFDSSYDRNQPATFPLTGVIKGWQEILPMMKTGAKWQVFIPSDLAYGPRGSGGGIGPNETLVFDIELLEIKAK